jgi:eukaryotic-like serine/threonine-protein kinase
VTDLIGQTLGNYQITSVIGEGGMGTVYLGEHRTLRRKAAVKVLKRQFAADANMVKRFVEEARAASAVAHPNIVDIHDVGTLADGLPFMLMEYLNGESLGRRLARVGRLSPSEARSVVIQASSALEAVHDRGVVHRDLKPDNLFLVPDSLVPGGERVKVLDFGVAKLRGDLSGGGVQTRSGTLLGTPHYMSPEQCRGLNDLIDSRTDIYALGVILYEMLCGETPFQAPSFGDLVVLHVTTPPPRPTAKAPDMPPEMERAILRALEKSPDDRFQTMADFRRALGTISVETMVGAPARAALRPSDRPTTPAAMPATTTLSGTAGETLRVSFYRRAPFVIAGAAVVVALAGVLALSRGRAPTSSNAILVAPPAPAPSPVVAPPPMAPPAQQPAETTPQPPLETTPQPPLETPVPPPAVVASPSSQTPGARRRRRQAGAPALVAVVASPDAGVAPAPDAPAAPAAAPVPAAPPKPKAVKW